MNDTMELTEEAAARGIDLAAWIGKLDGFAAESYACEDCSGASEWYVLKSEDIKRAAERMGYDWRDAVRAYAVLSQNAAVAENDRNYVALLFTGETKGLPLRAERAKRALAGDASAVHYVNGRKIPSFDDNLAYPLTSDAWTGDRHAIDIVTGDRKLTGRMLGWSHALGYRMVEAVYSVIAARLGVRKSQLQAQTWVHWAHVNESKAHGDWQAYRTTKGI